MSRATSSALRSWLITPLNLFIPLLILAPLLWALLPGGLPNSADGMVHFTRITEIVSSWRAGVLLPRWSLNLGFGYGVPVFIFGPPLSYWIGAAYNLLGFGPEVAYKAMLVTALYIGASGAYRLGKTLLGIWAGIIAATAFVYAPNQLFTLFVQGNAPQLLAWGLLPWTLWATIQIFRSVRPRQQWRYALVLALTVGGALISHNVVSLILAPTVALLAITLWIATRRWRALWITAAAGAVGALMGVWFAVPALLETVYASTDAIVSFDYNRYFVPLPELLAWPVRLDAGAINPYIPRTLGMPEVIVAALGLVMAVWWLIQNRSGQARGPAPTELLPVGAGLRARPSAHPSANPSDDSRLDNRILIATTIFMALYALFCAWMATRASHALWAKLPLLSFFQFPARWIGFAGFGLAWLAAVLAGLLPRRFQPLATGILCLFLIGSALVNLYPDKTLPGTRTMSPYEVVRYEVKSGAIGTTSYGEFNPRWVPRPLPPSPMVEDYMAQRPIDRLKGVLPSGSSHRILQVNAQRQLYEISLTSPATISVNLLYFPGWRATVNQKAAEIWPQVGTGLITVALPAGESTLDLTFGPTPLRRAMGLLSAATWIAFLLATLFVIVRVRAAPSPTATPAKEMALATAITAAAVTVALLLQIGGASWFQLASAPDQALAAPIPRHDDVGDTFRLLGQTPLPDTIHAGDLLSVVADRRALAKMDENYAVVLRLDDVGSGQTLVEAEQSHPSNIPTSGWATGLYLRNEWQLPIPADALPIQYAVRIGFRHHTSGEMLPTQEGDTLELGRLWVMPKSAPKPAAGPHVRFGPTIELLGARTDGTTLTLYWRANQTMSEDDRIFIHLLDGEGQSLGQLDGLPFDNRYPVWAWQPGQIIEDKRDLAGKGFDLALIRKVAVGLYNGATNERLAAVDDSGKTLVDNEVVIDWNSGLAQ